MVQYQVRKLWFQSGYSRLGQSFSGSDRGSGGCIIFLLWGVALVQFLLRPERRHRLCAGLLLAGAALWSASSRGRLQSQRPAAAPEQWEMSLEGGRKLTYQRSFSSEH